MTTESRRIRAFFPMKAALLAVGLMLTDATPAVAQSGDAPNVLLEGAGSEKLRRDIRPPDVVHWRAASATLYANDWLEIGLQLSTERGFTVYADRLRIVAPNGSLQLHGVEAPATTSMIDPIEQKPVDVYTDGAFIVRYRRSGGEAPSELRLAVTYTGCSSGICLFPYTETLVIPVHESAETYADGAGAAANPDNALAPDSTTTGSEVSSDDARGEAEAGSSLAGLEKDIVRNFESGKSSILLTLLIIFLGGLLSNLSPCVYPMIPITLRILGTSGRPFTFASCYGLGIVVTYTSLGVFAGFTGTLFGKFMQNPGVNLFFAVVMALLGLSMLGFGNFNAIQGLGNRLGAGKPSPRNTFLMGVGAGLVAAPCVGPVLLALLGYAAKTGDLLISTSLLLAYSVGFAAPYVALGGSAAKLTKRRFSHHVQVGVKILFAAVMFGLALYYLRIPFYRLVTALTGIWPYVAAGGIGLGALLTAYWVISPQLYNNKAMLVVPTFVLGLGFFGSYNWVTRSGAPSELTWIKTETEAYAAAQREAKPLLIDGWAEWCEACKKMDATTLRDPRIVEELANHWVLLKLDLTESTDENDALVEKYQFPGLPSLAMIRDQSKQIKDEQGRMKVLSGYQSADELLTALQAFR